MTAEVEAPAHVIRRRTVPLPVGTVLERGRHAVIQETVTVRVAGSAMSLTLPLPELSAALVVPWWPDQAWLTI